MLASLSRLGNQRATRGADVACVGSKRPLLRVAQVCMCGDGGGWSFAFTLMPRTGVERHVPTPVLVAMMPCMPRWWLTAPCWQHATDVYAWQAGSWSSSGPPTSSRTMPHPYRFVFLVVLNSVSSPDTSCRCDVFNLLLVLEPDLNAAGMSCPAVTFGRVCGNQPA